MSGTPLTDAINALTTYANEITGQSDTTLSDAVESLVDGYGGGGADYTAILDGTLSGSYENSNVTFLNSRIFSNMVDLTHISLPNVTEFKNFDCQFQYDSNLVSFNLPKLAKLYNNGNYTFRSCSKLVGAVLPSYLGELGQGFFYECFLLQYCDLKVKSIKAESLRSADSCSVIILRKADNLVTLGNTGALNNNVFKSGGTGGAIYIPKVLYDHLGDGTSLDYKAATNWSTINGYGTITWAKIEGSIYETQYADGTPIT